MKTNDIRNQNFHFTDHTLEMMEKRRISRELVMRTLKTGFRIQNVFANQHTSEVTFVLGCFKVVVGPHPMNKNKWSIVSCFWNDRVEGIEYPGMSPHPDQLEKFLSMKNGWVGVK